MQIQVKVDSISATKADRKGLVSAKFFFMINHSHAAYVKKAVTIKIRGAETMDLVEVKQELNIIEKRINDFRGSL
ncbi:hypothetical protein [Fictibacillus barbaricus]|uniref:Uncharacterized protein n=1 Tax=Fictibacillus barbaricus TaxID=182136 RepID=A0ABU1U0W8_9BACL|nr:hypothetical protein [Fictibacillus barbaricus]MDR7073118.1 hypothetical protein [Fictibacillus barbaricus]